MNDILRPITPDGNVGFDQYNQLFCWVQRGESKVGTVIGDMREKVCRICNHGWELTAESMMDQHHWQLIDDWVHESCLIRYSALRERTEFRGALLDARSGAVEVRFNMEEIPNDYWGAGDPYGAKPWYRFKLLDFPEVWFIVGNRKRVIHVEAIPNGGDLSWWEAAEEAFAAENVTKHFRPDSVLLHAWTEDKLKEYVARLCWFAEGRSGDGETRLTQEEFDAMNDSLPYMNENMGVRWRTQVHPALRAVSHVEEWVMGEFVDPNGCRRIHEKVEKFGTPNTKLGIRWTKIVMKKE